MTDKKSFELAECVYVGIQCSKCKKEECSYGDDVYSFADGLVSYGWHSTRGGSVICPSCSKKKKKARSK